MSDRVSASISIGGVVPAALHDELFAIIEFEGLCMDWEGTAFTPDQIEHGKPLDLMEHEVPWGIFERLEQFCVNHGLAYRRNSGACPGSFGAERIVFDGRQGPFNYDINDDDVVMLSAATIGQLGSMGAIRAYLKPAEIEIPPLLIASPERAAG